jgi:hypothetical protein
MPNVKLGSATAIGLYLRMSVGRAIGVIVAAYFMA